MKHQGLRGMVRGKVVRTTISDCKAPYPLDKVNRQFKADRPNQLWLADLTYVATWLYVVFVVDAMVLALYARQPERDSYDNARAETINGLDKAELIHRWDLWKTKESMERATLRWVSWFNHHRPLEPFGYIPPAEAEANYCRQLASQATAVEA